MIGSGYFSHEQPTRFQPILNALLHQGHDHFLVLPDYADYVACQNRVDELYRDSEEWTRRAILNVANMGRFSSDRTILEYAEEIWGVKAVKSE